MESAENVKVYKYRWVILILFCLHAAISLMQFLQYSVISNLVQKYYNVDATFVSLSSLAFMASYIIFSIPVNYFLEGFNLRWTASISSGLTVLGSVMKYFAVAPNLFDLALCGQFLTALDHIFILSVITKVASTWFGPSEISTASGLALVGTQVGIIIGNFWPPIMVKNAEEFEDGLRTMMVINMSIAIIVFVATVVGFKAKPILPPSQSQVNILNNPGMPIGRVFREIFKNKAYLWLNLIFAMCVAVWTSLGIMGNSIYLHFFPNSELDIGFIMAICTFSGGCLGSVVFGYVLDKWHRFKLTMFLVTFCSGFVFIVVGITFALRLKLATYFSIPIWGFFLGSSQLIALEFATEIMYPVPANYACCVINSVCCIFTIVYSLVLSALIASDCYLALFIVMCSSIFIGSCLSYFTNPRLSRREANLSH